MKKVICLALVFALSAVMLSATVFAAEARWNNVASISPSISVNDGCYTSAITGLKGTTKIDCTMVLYQKNWLGLYTEVSRTNETYYGRMHEFVGYYDFRVGITYKLDITAIVTCNGSDETVTYSFEK